MIKILRKFKTSIALILYFILFNVFINKINNFPEQIEYQTFLLNQDNRVLIIGNPIKNEKLWNLYLRTINNSAK